MPMNPDQLRSQALSALNEAVVKMTSAEWDAQLENASAQDRRKAARLLLQTQHARLVLGNAVLQDIAGKLQQNEAALNQGIRALSGALARLDGVANVLNALGSVLRVVAKVVDLA